MKNGFYVIDADRHLMEPADLWYRYIDDEFKDRAPYGVGEFGATTVVDGVQNNGGTTFNGMDRETLKNLRNTQGLITGFSKDIHWRYKYYDAIEESFSPKSYIVDMDKENIDAHPAPKNPHFEAKTPLETPFPEKKTRNTLNQTQTMYGWVSLNLKDS